MSNKTINEDNVKWPSKKKYPCKRGKGEHEWGEVKIIDPPSIRYVYKTDGGILDSPEFDKDKELKYAELSMIAEIRCKKCGHKALSLISKKIS